MSDGIVLHACLRSPQPCPSWHDPLLRALPYSRQLHLSSRNQQQQQASLAGLALALIAAERITGRPFAPRDLILPQDGKPILRNGPGISVSHADSRVAVLASTLQDCGIDIEDVGADADAATIGKLQRWTATEAALKAVGLGVRDMREVDVDEAIECALVRGERFTLQSLTSLPGVIGHVASRSSCELVIAELDLGSDELSAALERSLSLPAQLD